MGYEKGKSAGRPPGAKNKRTLKVEEIAAKYNLDPFEVLMMVVNNDWKGLGYESPTKISYTGAGIEFEEREVKLPDRIQAAARACKYLYSEKKAVELSTGENAIRIEIVDYTSEKK